MSSKNQVFIQQARSAFQRGDLTAVITITQASLSASPGDTELLSLAAAALAMSGRSAEAAAYYQQLVEIHPNDDKQWGNLGNALCDAKQFDKAATALHKAVSIDPSNSYAHFALARTYQAQGDAQDALKHANLACELLPNDSGFIILLAKLCLWTDDWDATRATLNRLSNQRIPPQQLIEIADIYLQMNLYDESRSAFNLALSVQPNNPFALLGLGLLEERVNAIDAATTCVEKVRRLFTGASNEPWFQRLQQLEARLAFRNKDFQLAAKLLTQLVIKAPADPILQSHLHFELGSAYDQAGEISSAWQAFQTAHAVRLRHLRLGFKGVAGNDLIEILNKPNISISKKSHLSISDKHRDPVFIVGFPRSGTTLLEQILDMQPDLASFDEQPFLQLLLVELRKRSLLYPDDVNKIDDPTKLELRALYFEYIKYAVPNLAARRAVDKNPLNLVRLPFAQTFLPNSKVILAIRHPCDVVLSCYMQSFRTPALESSFSSLEATAELYSKSMRCWKNFRHDLQLPIHINRYEDLVSDTSKTTQAIASFLELPWNNTWLNAAEHVHSKGAIRTPSYAQVSEPIHQKAKDRWLRYRKYFSTTCLDHLTPWIEEFGYPIVE
jgi:tetratricopeptide (TPR) repeat protein